MSEIKDKHMVQVCDFETDIAVDGSWKDARGFYDINEAVEYVSQHEGFNYSGVLIWVNTRSRTLYRIKSETITKTLYRF